MNSLIDRGLIECKGRLDVPGRPMLYGTTSDFLRCFGIKDLDSLPRTTEEMMDAFAKAKIDTDPTDNSVSNAEQLQIIETEKDSSTEEQIEAPSVESTEEVKYELEEPSAEDDLTADNND